MHNLLEKLEALIEKWENPPYGDLTKAAKAVCAGELREIIGYRSTTWCQDKSSTDADSQKGYYSDIPF